MTSYPAREGKGEGKGAQEEKTPALADSLHIAMQHRDCDLQNQMPAPLFLPEQTHVIVTLSQRFQRGAMREKSEPIRCLRPAGLSCISLARNARKKRARAQHWRAKK
jgi:hypothetical protein